MKPLTILALICTAAAQSAVCNDLTTENPQCCAHFADTIINGIA